MQELGTYIGKDVRSKLNGMCGMFRVDVLGGIRKFPGKGAGIRETNKKCPPTPGVVSY